MGMPFLYIPSYVAALINRFFKVKLPSVNGVNAVFRNSPDDREESVPDIASRYLIIQGITQRDNLKIYLSQEIVT